MSVYIETIVSCDGCGTNWCEGDDRRDTAATQRAYFKDEGWHYYKGKDWCPECWPNRNALRREEGA